MESGSAVAAVTKSRGGSVTSRRRSPLGADVPEASYLAALQIDVAQAADL